MLFKKLDGESQVRFYIAKCKYCGKKFIKFENRTVYCSNNCKHFSRLEQKAEYQRKRRKLINEGHLVSNESRYVGTGFLSANRNVNFDVESQSIKRELARLKI